MFDKKQHHENSSLRENIIEHLFVGEALRELWRIGRVDAEILRSEFDAYGYDLVVSYGNIVRHVQLKSGTSMKPVSASLQLSQKPSGCIIFILVDDTLKPGSYFYFGNKPGTALAPLLDFKVAKRTTPNGNNVKPERKSHRIVPVNQFVRHENLQSILTALLGIPFTGELDGE